MVTETPAAKLEFKRQFLVLEVCQFNNGFTDLSEFASLVRGMKCLNFPFFYRTPDLGYDWKTNTGRVFNYFCFGAACSEVEIDCLTGDHQVRPLVSHYLESVG